MNAVICGSAGIALLVEDDRLFYDITSPETLVPRTPEEYSFLFAGSRDVEFLDDVSRDEVDRRLARAVARARALHLALLLIDGTWSAATRRAAAAELESLSPSTKTMTTSERALLPSATGRRGGAERAAAMRGRSNTCAARRSHQGAALDHLKCGSHGRKQLADMRPTGTPICSHELRR